MSTMRANCVVLRAARKLAKNQRPLARSPRRRLPPALAVPPAAARREASGAPES
jgi:hypothetical protein